MKRFLLALAPVLLTACATTLANANCTPPKNSGVVICFPTSNSTSTFPVKVEGAATGDNGLPIIQMILYADNVKEYEIKNYDTFTWNWSYQGFNDPLEFNGWHHVVLNAWDQQGHLFQTSEYVNVIDGAVAFCAYPKSGFNLCSPGNGGYQPVNHIVVVASGASNIKSYAVSLDGGPPDMTYDVNLDGVWGLGAADNKTHTLSITATDSSGHTYNQTVSFKVYWTGYACGKNGCDPGVFINSPNDQQDANSPFTVDAAVEYNTHVISAMKVYLDNSVVLTSTGPTIRGSVSASPGTHLLTVQAWDVTGTLYKTQFTVNVQ